MATYLVQLDLNSIGTELSAALGTTIAPADVREILQGVGYVESSQGWVVKDLRPLMLALGRPDCCAIGAF